MLCHWTSQRNSFYSKLMASYFCSVGTCLFNFTVLTRIKKAKLSLKWTKKMNKTTLTMCCTARCAVQAEGQNPNKTYQGCICINEWKREPRATLCRQSWGKYKISEAQRRVLWWCVCGWARLEQLVRCYVAEGQLCVFSIFFSASFLSSPLPL